MSRSITLGRRIEKPTLKTTSMPPKGTKVKPGDTIKVTMVAARNDATRWQTGDREHLLIAKNPVVTSWSALGLPAGDSRRTARAGWNRELLVLTYTVPPNPPPIVRLRAIAEDSAGLMDTDVGEFPTGDWYGTFGWTHICVGGGNRDETRGVSDLTLDYDGRGNLTGTLAGSTPERKQTMPPCSFSKCRARNVQRQAGWVLHARAGYVFSPSRRGADNARPGVLDLSSRDHRNRPGVL